MATHPEVKFPREIFEGDIGKDVVAHKRAISRWNPDVYPWTDFSNIAGEFFMNAVVVFKKQHGLGAERKMGQLAHNALERAHQKYHPRGWAFDARSVELAQEYYDAVTISPEEKIRGGIKYAAFFWYMNRMVIHYSQTRPMELLKPPRIPSRWDCSAFATNCHYAGGGPDPNGRGYDRQGYTGTLMSRGSRTNLDGMKIGDLIFYGWSGGKPGFNRGDPTHVAVYVGNNMVISLGHYPMIYARYTYRSDLNHFRHYDVGV